MSFELSRTLFVGSPAALLSVGGPDISWAETLRSGGEGALHENLRQPGAAYTAVYPDVTIEAAGS